MIHIYENETTKFEPRLVKNETNFYLHWKFETAQNQP